MGLFVYCLKRIRSARARQPQRPQSALASPPVVSDDLPAPWMYLVAVQYRVVLPYVACAVITQQSRYAWARAYKATSLLCMHFTEKVLFSSLQSVCTNAVMHPVLPPARV